MFRGKGFVPGTNQKEKEVEQDGQQHIGYLDDGKPYGTLFKPQVGEGDGAQHVETKDHDHDEEVVGFHCGASQGKCRGTQDGQREEEK